MKRTLINVGAACSVVLMTGFAHARDLGVLVLPIHEGKFTSSLLYENLHLQDDFDTYGRVDFKSNVAGAQFSYGITDQVAVSVKGGTFIDPEVEAQGSTWQSRAGYLYGVDLYNEVFPATPGLRPGLQLSGGVSGFQVPLDRTNWSGTPGVPGPWQTIDDKMSGVEYHGAVLATFKWWKTEPYAGVRGFGGQVNWQANELGGMGITGHEHGNISLIAGLPVQITKDLKFVAESRFVNETAVTAGFTVAAF